MILRASVRCRAGPASTGPEPSGSGGFDSTSFVPAVRGAGPEPCFPAIQPRSSQSERKF